MPSTIPAAVMEQRRAPRGGRGGRRRRRPRHLHRTRRSRHRGDPGDDGRRHRPRRSGRHLGTERAGLDRRRARGALRRRGARAGQHPVEGRRSGVPAVGRQGLPAVSPRSASSTPTRWRCSTTTRPSCPTCARSSSSTVPPSRARARKARGRRIWRDFLAGGERRHDGGGVGAFAFGRTDRCQRHAVHVRHDRPAEGRRDDPRPDGRPVHRVVRLRRSATRRSVPDRQPVLPHVRIQGGLARQPPAWRHDRAGRACSTCRPCSTSCRPSASRCSPARRRSTGRSSTTPAAATTT